MKVSDYIIHSICTYPGLYAKDTLKESSMKVMDQLLNVIGNDIRDDEDLLEEVNFTTQHTKEEALKWIKRTIYYGYTEVKEYQNINGENVLGPDGEAVEISESDLKKHPEIIYKYVSKKFPLILIPISAKNIPPCGDARHISPLEKIG
jgi:hypothetical protein